MSQQRILGVFSLAMINVAAIISLRNLSFMVEYGFSSVFYYCLAALIFFIPSALVCAELATAWPEAGGLYAWVSKAFGKNIGFFAVWISWMLSVAWYPTVLTFTSGTLAYLIYPELINNKFFMVFSMLCIFWAATTLNFLGMKTSSRISTYGAIIGTLIPGALIISLGVAWYCMGNPIQIEISINKLIPEFKIDNMVFFAGVLLGLSGMEMSAFHAREAKCPQKAYPRAILISTILILSVSILGSLSIAFVVSHEEVSLFAGLLQAFNIFFTAFHMDKLMPVIAFMALIGSLAGLNTWILGPAKGIMTCAQDGFLPPLLQTMNRHQMPVGTLTFQAIVGSVLSLLFFFMPDVNSGFWLLTAITIIFAMIMYALIFASAIKLRYSYPDVKRTYTIPGGKIGIWIVAGTGILTALFTIHICFIPPWQLQVSSPILYKTYLLLSVGALSLPPLFLAKQKTNKNILLKQIGS